jgi:CCR4-NOT transcription complex subunit 1
LSIPELDMQLARLMDMGRMPVVEFGAKLMRKCLFEEPQIATPNDFFNSIEMLHKFKQQGKATDL